jgi:hypothetical protein
MLKEIKRPLKELKNQYYIVHEPNLGAISMWAFGKKGSVSFHNETCWGPFASVPIAKEACKQRPGRYAILTRVEEIEVS